MTCDICKGEHQTWECPAALCATRDTFECLHERLFAALDIMPVETAYLAALKRITELEAELAEARARITELERAS